MALKKKLKIPPGLVKCDVCGFYNGETAMKNFSFEEGVGFADDAESDEIVSVQCRCHGILCKSCNKTKLLRPGSNVYYPEDNTFEHVPYFAAMMPCDECRKKEKTAQTTRKKGSRQQ